MGVYCQLDLFGTECSYYQLFTEYDMPSDAQRMDVIVRLIKEGFEDRVLMSHDIHTKHRLVCCFLLDLFFYFFETILIKMFFLPQSLR